MIPRYKQFLAFPGSSCRSTKYAIMPPIIARKIGRRNHQLLLGLCISNDLYCQLSLLIVGIGGVTHRSSRCRLMTLTCSWMVVIAGICPSPLTREIHSQRHLSLAFLVPRPFTTRSRICGGLHPSVCGGYHDVCNFLYSNLEILVVELQLSDSHGMLYRTGRLGWRITEHEFRSPSSRDCWQRRPLHALYRNAHDF